MACTTFVEYKNFRNTLLKPEALVQNKITTPLYNGVPLKSQKKYAEGGLDPPDSPSRKNKVRKES